MKRNKHSGVFAAIRDAAGSHKLLSAGTLLCAAASVLSSLLPPLLLGQIIDSLTGGAPLVFTAALLYFGIMLLLASLVINLAGPGFVQYAMSISGY